MSATSDPPPKGPRPQGAAHGSTSVSQALEHWAWLGRLCSRLVADPSLAEDVRQEAWIAASRRGAEELDRRSLSKAAKRFVWRSRRSARRRALREAEVAAPEALPSVDELVSRSEQQRRVWEELMKLDEPFRSTLLLHYQEGLRPGEIADRLNLPADTIRWRLRRGVEKLREVLGADRAGGGLAAVALGVPASIAPQAGVVSKAGITALSAAAAAIPASFYSSIVLVMLKVVGSLAALLLVVLGARAVLSAPPPTLGDEDKPGAESAADPALVSVGRREAAELEALPSELAIVERRGLAINAPSAASTGSSSRSTLVGRVIDPRHEPIRKAEIVVDCKSHGFHKTVFSGDDGRFELEVPYNLNAILRVVVTSSDFTTARLVTVGQKQGAVVPIPNSVGRPTDLGDIALVSARVVIGDVVNAGGEPVKDVSIFAAQSPVVKGAADGSFRLGSIGAKARFITVRAPGYESKQVPFEALPGSVCNVGQIKLAAKASSDAEPESDFPDRVVCTLRIIDSATGEGLLEYRSQLVERRSPSGGFSSLAGLSRPEDGEALYMKLHQSSELKISAEPGLDDVTISAPGYLTRQVTVEPMAASGVQEVDLKTAPVVSGRVVQAGQPVPFAEVVIVLGRHLPIKNGSLMDGEDFRRTFKAHSPIVFPTNGTLPEKMGVTSRGVWPGMKRVIYADETGRFSLALAKERAGTVSVSHLQSDSRQVLFELDGSENTDLGDLEILPQTTLRGLLRFSSGESAAGYEIVRLGAVEERVSTDEAGRFQFSGLPQGDTYLEVVAQGTPLFLTGHEVQWFHALAEGGNENDITFEIETQGSALVEVAAIVNGQPAVGFELYTKGPGAKARRIRLDEKGRARTHVSAGRPIEVGLHKTGRHLQLARKIYSNEGRRP